MKNNIKTILVLCLVCTVVVALLAVGNAITEPIITNNQASVTKNTLRKVLPDGKDFEEIDISKYKFPESVIEAYAEKNGGYVFKMTVTGYSSGLVIMCGVDKNGNVVGSDVIASNETLGYEYSYGDKFSGVNYDTLDKVDTVSGATKTTTAYKNAIKDALAAFKVVNGGEVDFRSEDQILNDNLSNALSAANGKFTEVFISEDVSLINELYKADNDSGYVAIVSDKFVAFDNDANVLSDVSDVDLTLFKSEALALIKSTLTEIDISAYTDMPSQVQKAYKTSNNNYVFELRAAGYGINGDKYNNPSGEYIGILASVTADGKIISVKTVFENETDGIGSECSNKEFYSQFKGKNEENYNKIDAISGATITTNGYLTAISRMFTALKLIKGEV